MNLRLKLFAQRALAALIEYSESRKNVGHKSQNIIERYRPAPERQHIKKRGGIHAINWPHAGY